MPPAPAQDLPGELADQLADVLLGYSAQSVMWVNKETRMNVGRASCLETSPNLVRAM